MTKHLTKLLLLAGLLLTLPLFGCVSKGNFEAMVKERDMALGTVARVEAERDGLQAEHQQLTVERDELLKAKSQLNTQLSQTEQQKQAAAREAAAVKAQLAKQQAVYDGLKSTFAKEQEENQVKIEMMKSGIKVNLANEILFPSGSATLDAAGRDILTKAAAELKDVSYQTLVAGFSDNVAISERLKDRYPSNWELAAARAASVVRLLTEQGVPAEQLVALSFGENHPLMSNDTPEGRSKNRRIEILLRPVPVEL